MTEKLKKIKGGSRDRFSKMRAITRRERVQMKKRPPTFGIEHIKTDAEKIWDQMVRECT